MILGCIRKRLNQMGTAIIEYALLLAFVAVIGSAFVSSDGISKNIQNIFTNITELLDGKANEGGEETGKPTEPEQPGSGDGEGTENPTPPTAEEEAINQLSELKKKYDALSKDDKHSNIGRELKDQYKDLHKSFKDKGYDLSGIPADINGNWNTNK